MSRLDDAIKRLEREPDEPPEGYITPADLADAFEDLHDATEDLSLTKQDALPTAGADGEVLTLVGGTWMPAPPRTPGGAAVPTTDPTLNGQFLGVANGAPEWQNLPAEVPPYTTTQAGQVLTVTGGGGLVWRDVSALMGAAVLTFRGVVPNAAGLPATAAEGDVWVTQDDGSMHLWTAGRFQTLGNAAGNTLPGAQTTDNGKVLTVVGGTARWETPHPELPPSTGADNGKVLTVSPGGAPAWQAPSSVSAAVSSLIGNPTAWSATPGVYVKGTLVTYGNNLYISAQATTAQDIPGASAAWSQVSLQGLAAASQQAPTQFRGSVPNEGSLATLATPFDGDVAVTRDTGLVYVYRAGQWRKPAALPAGGTAGQVLAKNSATDGDAGWVTPAAGGATIPVGQSTVPTPSAANNGQVLGVVAGAATWRGESKELPAFTNANDGQVLSVNNQGALVWTTPATPAAGAAPTSFKGTVATATALPTTAALGDTYVTLDDGHLHICTAVGPPAVFDNIGPSTAAAGTGLPAVGTDGQVLTVVGGAAAWAAAPTELPAHTVADAEKALHVLPDGSVGWKYAVPIVVKATQPTAADYGEATIPNGAIWVRVI